MHAATPSPGSSDWMSAHTTQFAVDALGVTGEPHGFAVEQERIEAYAAATNDTGSDSGQGVTIDGLAEIG
jgi:hypothetical protein